jgi:hypothetical protein
MFPVPEIIRLTVWISGSWILERDNRSIRWLENFRRTYDVCSPSHVSICICIIKLEYKFIIIDPLFNDNFYVHVRIIGLHTPIVFNISYITSKL